MAGAKLKFPNPNKCKPEDAAVLCPADRVIGLYNQNGGDAAKRIAQKVRLWFAAEALKNGWAGVHFLPDVQSKHGAGCVLWLPPRQVNISINITNTTLVLTAQDK